MIKFTVFSFELISIGSVQQGLKFVYCHTVIQLSWHYLLKRLPTISLDRDRIDQIDKDMDVAINRQTHQRQAGSESSGLILESVLFIDLFFCPDANAILSFSL